MWSEGGVCGVSVERVWGDHDMWSMCGMSAE